MFYPEGKTYFGDFLEIFMTRYSSLANRMLTSPTPAELEATKKLEESLAETRVILHDFEPIKFDVYNL